MNSPEEERAVIICAPVGEYDENMTRGSITDTCRDCGCEVWLAPTGQMIIAEKNAQPVCVPCGLIHLRRENAQVQPLTDAQRKEVEEEIRRSFL